MSSLPTHLLPLQVASIPTDLIEKILLQLPVKTLVRFTLTCKEWFSLVRQKRFIYSRHMKLGQDLLFLHSRVSAIWMLELHDLINMSYLQVQVFEDKVIRSLSQCDGLIVCSTLSYHTTLPGRTKVVFWNCLQGKYTWIERDDLSIYDRYTLGRDSNMHYKLLRFTSGRFDQTCDFYGPEAEVYELENSCWKSVDMTVGWSLYMNKWRVISVDVSSYWLATYKDILFVQSFDFETDTFKPFPAPLGVEECTGAVAISTLGGENLLILDQQLRQSLTDIWVRNDKGKWEKLYIITGHQPVLSCPSFLVNQHEITIFNEVTADGNVAQIRLITVSQAGMQQYVIERYEYESISTSCAYTWSLVHV